MRAPGTPGITWGCASRSGHHNILYAKSSVAFCECRADLLRVANVIAGASGVGERRPVAGDCGPSDVATPVLPSRFVVVPPAPFLRAHRTHPAGPDGARRWARVRALQTGPPPARAVLCASLERFSPQRRQPQTLARPGFCPPAPPRAPRRPSSFHVASLTRSDRGHVSPAGSAPHRSGGSRMKRHVDSSGPSQARADLCALPLVLGPGSRPRPSRPGGPSGASRASVKGLMAGGGANARGGGPAPVP